VATVGEEARVSDYTYIRSKESVSDEILRGAEYTNDLWFNDVSRIKWSQFWDLLEGWPLLDGTCLDLGAELGTPAMKEIKKHIRAYRAGITEFLRTGNGSSTTKA
jgi:hypothetical protein